MPHVVVKLFPGRTDKQKESCTQKIVIALEEALGVPEGSVSISFKEIEKNNWEDSVYRPEIIGDGDNLYKKPGYRMTNGEIVNN